jgi:hypothetical protein
MKRFAKSFLTVLLMVCMVCSALPVQAASRTQTKTSSTKTTVKNGWVKESAGWCYYVKGKKLTSQLKKISGKTYYLGADGVRKTGWYTVKVNGTYKAYYFNSNGAWNGKSHEVSAALVKKMDGLIKYLKVSASTADTKSCQEALKTLFDYGVENWAYARAPLSFNANNGWKPTGWQYTFALEMMTNKKGSCFHDAAAFALLAKRATGLPVRICLGTSNAYGSWSAHGWVEIKIDGTWYTYDTNAARFSKLRTGKWYQQKASAMNGKVYKVSKRIDVEI